MQPNHDRYPWIRRQPSVRIDDLFANAHPGEDTGPMRQITERWLRAVLRRASHPIQIEEAHNARRVTCMGVLRVTVSTRPGMCRYTVERRQWRWKADLGRRVPRWKKASRSTCLSVQSRRPAILDSLLNPWAFVGQDLLDARLGASNTPGPDDPRRRLRRWSAHAPFQWIRHWIDEPMLQRMLAEVLGIDDLVLRIGAMTWNRPPETLADLEVIVAHRAWLARLAAEAPRLLRVGFVLRARGEWLDPNLEPVAGIKACLRRHGLTDGAWKLLCHVPDAPDRMRSVLINWGHPEDIARWLNGHVQAGLRTLAHDLFHWAYSMHLPDPQYEPHRRVSEPVFRILVRQAVAAEVQGTLEEWLRSVEWEVVQGWLDRHPGFVPDPNQARAGWRWMLRHVEREERERQRALFLDRVWPYALRGLRLPGFVARALESLREVEEEGTAMRHCLGGRNDDGAWAWRLERLDAGLDRYFSIREASSGERLATLQIERCRGSRNWWIEHCKGPSDTAVTASVMDFARRVVDAYALADRSGRSPAMPSG